MIVLCNAKISEVAREFPRMRNACAKILTTETIDGYHDRIKRRSEQSLIEYISIQCDIEAKELIREQVITSGNPGPLFTFQSLIVKNKSDMHLASTEIITNEICKQLAALCIEKKMNIVPMRDIGQKFK